MSLLKKITLSVITSAAMLTTTNATAQVETLFESPFKTTYNGYTKNAPYRIPAIVETKNVTTGAKEIIAFSDQRHGGGDVGQNQSNSAAWSSHINIVYKRSTDNGTSWSSDYTTIIEGNTNMGYGDVAVVADRENPENIVFFCAAGKTFFTNSVYPTSSVDNTLRCFRFRSSDGGQTWTNDEVTKDLYKATGNYAGAFISSGRICQSSQIKVGRYYRLYAALCVTGTNTVVLYSDDFGVTWNNLGNGVAVASGNEAKCEELPNGDVLVSARRANWNEGGRYYNVFTYSSKPTTANQANGSWGNRQLNSFAGSNSTNGEVLLVPAKNNSTNTDCYVLLQTLPIGSSRSDVSVYYKEISSNATEKYTSENFTSGWSGPYALSSTTSAYSTMILQNDNNIGFLYEDVEQSYGTGGYNIVYKRLSLETVTKKAYSVRTVTTDDSGNEGGNEGTGGDETETATVKYRFKNVQADGTAYYFKYAGTTSGLTLTTSVSEATLYTRTTVDAANGVFNFQSEDGSYLIWTGGNLYYNGYNNGLGYYPSYVSAYCDLTIEKMVSGGNVTSEFTAGEYVTIRGKRSGASGAENVYFVIKNGGTFDGANSPYFNTNFSSAFVIEEVKIDAEGGEDEEPVIETVSTPVISLKSGSYEDSAIFTITCETEDATIYYTTDGSDPATNGAEYTGPVTLNEVGNYSVKAIAIKDGCTNSQVVSVEITITEEATVTRPVADFNCSTGMCKKGRYSSFYYDCAVKIPSGVTAYRGVLTNDNTVRLYKVGNGIIPANYAVVLYDKYKRSELTFEKTKTNYNPGKNDFEGTLTDMTIEDKSQYYILGHTTSGHYGFYHPSSYTLGAYKAFMKVESGVEIKVRFEDEDATGIEGIFTEEDDNAPIYDLTGRKVNDTSKPGIYIKNGKKYIVR